ncbi:MULTISPECIES: hypothetical protein [Bradyrhizobium]|uniref:hypothetical protein n=1 Tax=Bradyrhizobium elkanii TaxID=29448 RepID=UPI0012BB55B4|nr:hypothetical protein [Bradyrhizobium elkanii]
MFNEKKGVINIANPKVAFIGLAVSGIATASLRGISGHFLQSMAPQLSAIVRKRAKPPC